MALLHRTLFECREVPPANIEFDYLFVYASSFSTPLTSDLGAALLLVRNADKRDVP